MEQWKYVYTLEEIDSILEKENTIAVYGAGDYGRRIIDHIFSLGEEYKRKIVSFLVTEKRDTDYEYRGIKVQRADAYLKGEDCFVLAAVSAPYQKSVVGVIERYGKNFCCLTEELYISILRKMETSYYGLDFLLVGFQKCATSSLFSVLRKIDDIYVPKEKETHFFNWCDTVEDAQKVLAEKYFSGIREGQIIGALDPGFYAKAKSVHESFGSQVKLLFLVRNPIEACFSDFKMVLRNGEEFCDDAYQGYENFSVDMFNRFVDKSRNVEQFRYINWIEKFKEYYPLEQIKIILFEELIDNTAEVLEDLLRYIGSKCKFKLEELPVENKGDFIPADIVSCRIGKQCNELRMELQNSYEKDPYIREEKYNAFLQSKQEFDKVEKIYAPQMSLEQRERLKAYYNDSVRRLEKFLGRDLSSLWF